jgi:drug/metabolite transporter (DMT)-like permease
MIVMNYFYIKYNGQNILNVGAKYRNIIVLRSFMGFIGIQGKLTSVKYMPVSTASCVFFIFPIFSLLLARAFLKESMSKLDITQMVMAFLGVIVINNPFEKVSLEEQSLNTFTRIDYVIGSLIALSGAIAAGGVSVVMRYMNKGIHYSISPFWFASGNALCSPILHSILVMNSDTYIDRIATRYDWTSIFLIGLASCGAFIGQILTSRAFQLEKVSRIAFCGYL